MMTFCKNKMLIYEKNIPTCTYSINKAQKKFLRSTKMRNRNVFLKRQYSLKFLTSVSQK